MKYQIPYFKDVPEVGSLFLEHIFIEGECPILFICKDINNKLYLCVCLEIVKEQNWIITQVENRSINNLIKKSTTLYRIFKTSNTVIKAFWSRDRGQRYSLVNGKEIPDEKLPVDEFLDFEGD